MSESADRSRTDDHLDAPAHEPSSHASRESSDAPGQPAAGAPRSGPPGRDAEGPPPTAPETAPPTAPPTAPETRAEGRSVEAGSDPAPPDDQAPQDGAERSAGDEASAEGEVRQRDDRNDRRRVQPPPGPRRVRGGIKLNAPDGDVLSAADEESRPIVAAWMACLERTFDPDTLQHGHEYAVRGQIVRMEFGRAEVSGMVQGTSSRPDPVTLRLPELDTDRWGRIVDRLSAEARFAASLLSGRLPGGFNELLEDLGIPIMPVDAERPIEVASNSREARESGRPCRQAAALGWIVADHLARDPMQAFPLRGLAVERLLDRIREARELESRGTTTAHPEPALSAIDGVDLPLESLVDEFWGSLAQIHALSETRPPDHAPHALLKRLGPSPLEGRFPFVGLLASIYDSVAGAARAQRDHAEHLDDPVDDDDEAHEADEPTA